METFSALVVIDILIMILLNRYIPIYIIIPWVFGLLSTVVKPMLYWLEGTYNVHYPAASAETYFAAGTVFLFTRIITNLIFLGARDCFSTPFTLPITTYRVRLAFLSLLPITYFFLTSGTSWLPGSRETTLTLLNPLYRILYPIVIYSCAILVMMLIIEKYALARNKKLLIPLFLLAALLTMLISQRGMLITSILISVLILYKIKRIKIIGILLIVSFAIMFGLLSRALMSDSGEIKSTLESFIYSGDGTQIDSLTCTYDYLKDNIYKDIPYNIFNELLGFLPHSARIDTGHNTVSDLLNIYWVGDVYTDNGFGYNFSNLNAFIIEFGHNWGAIYYWLYLLVIRLVIGALPLHRLNSIAILPIFLTTSALIFSLATLHWAIFSFLIYGAACLRITRNSLKI